MRTNHINIAILKEVEVCKYNFLLFYIKLCLYIVNSSKYFNSY